MKAEVGYKRENVDGKYVYIKRLDGGAYVIQHGDEFSAYDNQGRYLGWGAHQDAEFAAKNNYILSPSIDPVSDLSIWVMWNDAIAAGARVMIGSSGEQILCIGRVYIVAEKDENGYSVETIDSQELWARYGDAAIDVLHLHVVDSKDVFRLE